MTHKEINECLIEVFAVLQDVAILQRHDVTLEQFCSVPQFSNAVLLFAYWGLAEVDKELLKYAMIYATNDDFNYINERISDMWLKKAEAEIEVIVTELENSSDV